MFCKIVTVALVLFWVSACSPSTPIPTETPLPSPTPQPTATPTATPTPIPFSQLNLETALIKSGDLPAGVSGAQIRSSAPEMFKNVPTADYTIFQQFEKKGNAAGGVAVFVYESPERVESAYQEILGGMGETKPSTDFGDKANTSILSMTVAGITLEFSEALFIRCHAVAHIRMTDIADINAIVAYAQRLDERLREFVCR